MEASVSFHHKSFTQINIHSKQQQVEVPLINVFFMLVPVLNAPECVHHFVNFILVTYFAAQIKWEFNWIIKDELPKSGMYDRFSKTF